MAYPEGSPWAELYALGYRQVVCLTHDEELYEPSPLEVLHAVALEDLLGGSVPSQPEAEEAKIRAAVAEVCAAIRRGEGVVVHCHGGIGRTGTVLACALVELGADADEALERVRVARGGGLESPWQEQVVRSQRP
jgi:protein-tyrosine phosphatase